MAMASALQSHVMIKIPYFGLVSLRRRDHVCTKYSPTHILNRKLITGKNICFIMRVPGKKVGERREYEQTVGDVNNPPSANISYAISITYFIQYLRAQLTYTLAYIHNQ
jgi:hypothetical protein